MARDDQAPRLGRRLLVVRVATLGAAAAPLAGCVVAPPGPVYAPGPVRTGLTDADPSDGPGQGRGGYRARTGVTDSDPNDGPGQGRGGYRARTGLTDADPNDGPGQGRGGGYRRQVSDSDPRDAPGRGRGW
ncbi:hypothetical protein [Roseomonas rosulenta]|uniref:hypothetical protein n=1 Tax=Roseomonas rosulenta TaxID=2748667 RepID=UPI0018DFB403|nr:hypothetical protein [Roseomonas rosulenta]